MRYLLVLAPLYSWGNWGTERLSNLFAITQNILILSNNWRVELKRKVICYIQWFVFVKWIYLVLIVFSSWALLLNVTCTVCSSVQRVQCQAFFRSWSKLPHPLWVTWSFFCDSSNRTDLRFLEELHHLEHMWEKSESNWESRAAGWGRGWTHRNHSPPYLLFPQNGPLSFQRELEYKMEWPTKGELIGRKMWWLPTGLPPLPSQSFQPKASSDP